jgi:heme exporter protein D
MLPLVFFPYDVHVGLILSVALVATAAVRRHRQRLQDIQATLARLDRLTEEFKTFQGPDRRQPKHWT